jgi:Protein of unknown function (DUF429)
MKPETFVGIDLTDAYARNPREADVAILDANTGVVRFKTFAWPLFGANWAGDVAHLMQGFRGSTETVYVLDGPQALAEPQNNIRQSEKHLRTPGRTPWQVPQPRTRPFAGYLRSSVELYNALVAGGYQLAELNAEAADLYEAYPGAAWPRLHHAADPLQSKSTRIGRQQRRQILELMGCNFPRPNLSHDELDAALCAALGWRFYYPQNRCDVELAPPPTPSVAPALAVFRDQKGILREGRILMPLARRHTQNRADVNANELPVPDGAIQGLGAEADEAGSPAWKDAPTTWVYFATPAGANQADTYELVENEGAIVRRAYAKCQPPRAIPQVRDLQPGDTLLLAYGSDGQYIPLCRCSIGVPDNTPDGFNALGIADNAMAQRFVALGYEQPDPILGVHLYIPVTVDAHIHRRGCTIAKPIPAQQTIFTWAQVFG